MSLSYADDQFDLGITASPRLSRGMRLALILLGLLLVPLSLPLAFGFTIISGGGHARHSMVAQPNSRLALHSSPFRC